MPLAHVVSYEDAQTLQPQLEAIAADIELLVASLAEAKTGAYSLEAFRTLIPAATTSVEDLYKCAPWDRSSLRLSAE